MKGTRYFVRMESFVIGTFFQVYDGWHGTKVGEPQYFKDDAEKIANRLELQNENT